MPSGFSLSRLFAPRPEPAARATWEPWREIAERAARDGATADEVWSFEDLYTYGPNAQDVLPCPEVIDVTGRVRFLASGPHRPLPSGRWQANIYLHLCASAARRPIRVEFGAEPDYSFAQLPFDVAGPHRIALEHDFAHGDQAQVRIILQRAAFHGELRILGIVLRHATRPNPLPATPDA